MLDRLPVADVSLYINGTLEEKRNFCQTFGGAIEEFGFVIVENHGVDETLMANCYRQLESLFSLPVKEKLKYSHESTYGQRGYVGFGVEHAKDTNKLDLKEYWHVGREKFMDYRGKQISNIWPEHHAPDFRGNILQYYSCLDKLSCLLLQALAQFLGLPSETFSSMTENGNTVLRALHYPPVTKEQCAEGFVRAAPHEDINMITILCQSTQGGLEILTRQGNWLAVKCQPGQLIVDSGDMLSRITNNCIPATTHRVVNPAMSENVSRYSLPFFVHPSDLCELKVLDHFLTPTFCAKYPPVLTHEFLSERLRAIGVGNRSSLEKDE